MTERKRLRLLAKACRLFASKKKQKALAMVIKYKFNKLPFFNKATLWSVARLKGFYLLNNKGHYGRFFLVGRGAVPHLYVVQKSQFTSFAARSGIEDIEATLNGWCYLVNDASIPQLPTSVMYKLYLHWEEWHSR